MLLFLVTALLAVSAAAAPVLNTRAASAGCGKARTPGYNGPFTITSGGKTRTYKVQHGRGGSSDSQRKNSMYYDYTPSSNYVIVYPQGLSGEKGASWQGPTYAPAGVDDVRFVADLLAQFKNNYCIDTDRVFASGMSNGGGFVNTLACSDTGDQFAGFAMASAALYTDNQAPTCNKKRAILESHGDGDTTIPYVGGSGLGGNLPDVGLWAQRWGQRACPSAYASRSSKTGYDLTNFSCAGNANVVSHYRLKKPAGHCWPCSKGNNKDSIEDPTTCGAAKALDFSAVALQWFSTRSLKNVPK
ncbi:hypothetical protein Q7P37_003011 [Cladosporium fusiforme]